MNQLIQPIEGQSDERFRITGQTAILFSLNGYANHREQFTVYFNDGRESFLTFLLATNRDTGELIVDCSGSSELNDRFLRSARNIFVARPEGISVQFVVGQPRRVDFDGDEAFALPLPKFLVRLQRRDYFRITAPRAKPLMLSIRLPEDERTVSYPLHDLSVVGCGLRSKHMPAELAVGASLPDCQFVLPDAERTKISTAALVRHATALSSQPGPDAYRVGLQFDKLPKALEHRIQRYIVHVEHERRELAK